MPAEWENHEATWINWPHNETKYSKVGFFGKELGAVEDNTYVKIVRGLKGEKAKIVVDSYEMEKHVKKKLKEFNVDMSNVEFWNIPNHDVWERDHGPFYVKHKKTGKIAMVQGTFNSWGNKYVGLLQDTCIPAKINEIQKLPYFHMGLVIEGGAIEVNGKGTLLTTESVMLNKNRNPYLSKDTIEERMKDYLGVSKVIWLKEGLKDDDTDGHIDNLVRFVDERTVVCSVSEDKRDKNYSILERNLRRMKEETDQNGRKFDVIKLPSPGFVFGKDGRRLAASYANFYIANETVLVPVFGIDKRKDCSAVGMLVDIFSPERKIMLINCYDLLHSGGALHCVLMQQPASGFD